LDGLTTKLSLGELQEDLKLVVAEIHRDKIDIIKEEDLGAITSKSTRRKMDALGWHGRCLNLLSVQ
jgi:hypothetical protein